MIASQTGLLQLEVFCRDLNEIAMPTKQEFEDQLKQAKAKIAGLKALQGAGAEIAEKEAADREWTARLFAAEQDAELLRCREKESFDVNWCRCMSGSSKCTRACKGRWNSG